MTGPDVSPASEVATEPLDLAHGAAIEAMFNGADLAEWIVALVARVAVDPDLEANDIPVVARPGSWESALLTEIIASSGAEQNPEWHRREPPPPLHEHSVTDIARWLVPGVRELYGNELAAQTAALAAALDAAHTAKVRELLGGEQP